MRSFDFPTINRIDKTPPYSLPRNKKNKNWMNIQENIKKWLDNHFYKGETLALPNPLYPEQVRFDENFLINEYQWKFLPKSLDKLTGKPFKFYITNNWTNRQDPNLYILIKVRLRGRNIGKKRMKKQNPLLPLQTRGNSRRQLLLQ